MGDGLSIDELAERTGEPASRLADWRDRGLIGTKPALWATATRSGFG